MERGQARGRRLSGATPTRMRPRRVAIVVHASAPADPRIRRQSDALLASGYEVDILYLVRLDATGAALGVGGLRTVTVVGTPAAGAGIAGVATGELAVGAAAGGAGVAGVATGELAVGAALAGAGPVVAGFATGVALAAAGLVTGVELAAAG